MAEYYKFPLKKRYRILLLIAIPIMLLSITIPLSFARSYADWDIVDMPVDMIKAEDSLMGGSIHVAIVPRGWLESENCFIKWAVNHAPAIGYSLVWIKWSAILFLILLCALILIDWAEKARK